MDVWAQFYEKLFNFREIRYFDIQGKKTGLTSRALTSPCGKIRIPINEPSDRKSQIQEYLDAYHGEGIQHIALSTADIFATVEGLRGAGRALPRHAGQLLRARRRARAGTTARTSRGCGRNRILIDGEGLDKDRREDKLLQIFTETVIGPIFFEIIQRKGNEGFGEGNFRALFESIEADQIAQGSRLRTGSDATQGQGTRMNTDEHGCFLMRRTGADDGMRSFEYLSGFGAHHETEAVAGALPRGQNSPQKAPFGLYAEQLSAHRVHGAARAEPALVALPPAAGRDAPAVPPRSTAASCARGRAAKPTPAPTGCAGRPWPCRARPRTSSPVS